MRHYPKYIIAGWFDIMGILNGVEYIRFNQATCVNSKVK